MACNQLNMVCSQFRTRGYKTGDVESVREDRWTFMILGDPNDDPVGVEVAFIATTSNPQGDHWIPANVHWSTNKTNYAGTNERSAAELADTIVNTIADDNSQ
jgi:hypothetical protein